MKTIFNKLLSPFRACRYFILGLIVMNRRKRMQNFTRTFPGIGEMTGRGISEAKCRTWQMTIPKYLFWENVKVSFSGKHADAEALQTYAALYKMMTARAEDISASIKKQIKSPAVLKNTDQVEMQLNCFDFDEKTRHPYVCICYNTAKLYITIFIEQDGEVLVETNSNQ